MAFYSTKLALCLIVFALALATAATKTTEATILLPEQFHCSTELWLYDRDKSSGESSFIDEYVDRTNRRSSLKITDDANTDLIYYNQLFGPENGPIERQFVRYDPSKLTCARQDIYTLNLDRVRQLAIGILPTDNLSSRNVDIAIGPSGLMYAIESRLNELEYRGSAFDESRLIYTDIYELSIPKPFGDSYNSGKDLLLQVSTLHRAPDIYPRDKIRGKTLADVAHAALYKIHLVHVKICSVSAAKVKRRTKLAEPYRCQTGTDAQQQELDLVASFNLVEDLINDSLIGQPLEKAAQFDFELNPFAQPEGLGCGKSSPNRVTYNQRPSTAKSFMPESSQFSAEYFSLNGLKGLSYVAYDGDRQVLRHDRAGRKNIYDLARGRSYHLDEFHSLKSMFDQSQSLNCVELEIGDDMRLGSDVSVVSRLLGVDFGLEAAHIGTKIINDETFAMYELELSAPNLPILMEPIGFVMPTSSEQGSRFFMTYFVLEIPSVGDSATTVGEGVVKIPRFVELWQLKEATPAAAGGGGASRQDRQRSLVNLLEFTQFTWSLNIQPEEEDVAGSAGGVDDLSRVFSLESCALERGEQLLLSFNTIYSSVPTKYIRANRQLIEETYHEQLATCLDIPRTNLFALDLHLPGAGETGAQTGVWLLRARIGELVRGLEQDSLEGRVDFNRAQSWLMASHLFKGENRHSYDQCKLDSLSIRKANAIVYCAGLTTCLIVDAQAVEEHRAELYGSEMRTTGETCEVHRFTWRPVPSARNDERGSVLARVFENRNRILRTNFVVDLEPPAEGRTDRDKPVKYQGFGHGVKIQTLDDTVGRQMARQSLTGIRYLAAGEDATQANYAHKLSSTGGQQEQSFRQCHMVCQMDEYCESFSVCRPAIASAKAADFDCVLSTMRLTGAKMSDLAAELKSNEPIVSITVGSSSFDASSSEEAEGQVFKFKRQSGCSLHSKDILAQFKVEKSLALPIDLEASDRDLLKTPGANVVSLDECAGLANELALMGANSLDAQFVYCPMESLCLSDEGVQTSLQVKMASSSSVRTEQCFLYSKSHYVNFYDYTLFRKVALQFNGSYALEDDAVQRIGRVFEGLSVEQCARDCNLHQSRCLAFDMCEFETNVTTCTLYSIRSPLASKTKAGYLPDEERFYGKGGGGGGGDSATLVENGKCAHFNLKDSYFRLKIGQLLDSDTVVQRQKLDELERKLLELDAKLSDDKMMESILGNKDRDPSAAQPADKRRQVKESSSGGLMIHLMLLLSSAVCGALGYLYSGEAKTLAVDTIVYLRARRGQRFGEPRISQLNLPDNLQADL